MNTQDFSLSFSVDPSPEAVLAAIKDVRGWWSEGVEGGASAIGDEFVYRHRDIHYSKQKLVELTPTSVAWLVNDAYLKFTKDKAEWKGTQLRFDVARKDGKTEVRFTHVGLAREHECFDACSKAWSFYVGDSLRALITTGRGQPDKAAHTVNILHRVGIHASISQVYAALATVEGVAGWWTRETTGESRPGGAMKATFRTKTGELKGEMQFAVIALVRDKEVHWRFTSGPEEWLGTDVRFRLSQAGDMTLVAFSHENWREAVEFTAHCSMKWATFLLSLRQLVETGSGKPSPDDLKIDNWN